ncbi:MAG: hypothetical protein PHQ60_00270 [Sideroxydans sp.]|nr:hypothetical protein [Sideroxydans sp.]
MKHEDSQTDQRRAAKARVWTEIGEAQIIHTMFGKAKVRIILQRDKTRRASWLMAMLLALMATAVWLEWITSHPTERTQIVDISLPVNVTAQESAATPVVVDEHIPPPAVVRARKNPVVTAQTAAIPDQPRPVQAVQPQTPSTIAYNNATKNPAEETPAPTPISANQ